VVHRSDDESVRWAGLFSKIAEEESNKYASELVFGCDFCSLLSQSPTHWHFCGIKKQT